MIAKTIKMIMAYKETNISNLADLLGTSRPNLSQKMKRDNFSEREMIEIAEALNCELEIKFKDKLTGKEF